MTGIKDIAKRAGVSLAAVSRFLNKDATLSLSDATKARITKAVKDLHYIPNHAARSLKRRKSDTLGIILRHVDPYILGLLGNIEQKAASHNYTLLLAASQGDVRKETEFIGLMKQRLCDAAFVVNTYEPSSVVPMTEYRRAVAQLRCVFVDSKPPGDSWEYIVSDNYADSHKAVTHFITKGARAFVYVGSSLQLDVVNERKRGFTDALSGAGLSKDMTLLEGYDRLPQALTAAKDGTLFFFESLTTFSTALPHLIHSGRVIGRDIFVSGFDAPHIENPLAIIPSLGKAIQSPIPYVYQDKEAIATHAVENLVRTLGKSEKIRMKIASQFINFES
ncbi:MAG: LacI family DNA-binding transcriptional regulator [Spirochaetes bacterium]|nr:LacI family DNA-binding transcriptional regulator [Spirochaetota bacterium]